MKDNDIGAENVRIMSEMFARAILEREVKEERMDDYEPLTTPNVQTADSNIHEALAKLPDVPSELLNDASANPWCESSLNIDEEIEENLIKLQFFNKTWLSGEHKLDSNVKSDDTGSKELSKDTLDDTLEQVKAESIEPVYSTVDEREEFNRWYDVLVENRFPKTQTKIEPPVVQSKEMSTPLTSMTKKTQPSSSLPPYPCLIT